MNSVHDEDPRSSMWKLHSSDPIMTLDQIRETVRRAYAAGCDVPEFHRADCEEETDAILRDVLSQIRTEPFSHDRFWDSEEHIDRLRDMLVEAAKALPGQSGRIEIKDREIRVDLDGPGPLCIPVRALSGVDLRMVPAIVQSYVDAYTAGRGRGFDVIVPTCASDDEIEALIASSIRKLVRWPA